MIIISLFLKLIYRSIISTIIGIIIFILSKATKFRNTPRFKHLLWITFVLILLIPFSFSNKFSIYNYISFDNLENFEYSEEKNLFNNAYGGNYTDFDRFKSGIIYNRNNQIRMAVLNIFFVLWIGIVFLKLIDNFMRYFILNFKCENEIIKNERISKILDNCKEKLKIKRKINVINNDLIETPSISGIFNVKIFISDNFFELNDDELENIFLHELAHYKRKDNLINILILFLNSVYFFNPIIIKLLNIMKSNMEYATDELATKKMSKEERKKYCSVIIIATGISKNYTKSDLVLGLNSRKNKLTERIELILNRDINIKSRTVLIIFNILAILLILLFFGPTSYVNEEKDVLTVCISHGDVIELNSNSSEIPVINLLVDDYIELKINSNEYILYEEMSSSNQNLFLDGDKIKMYNKGEYFYKFIANNNENEYYLKVIVK